MLTIYVKFEFKLTGPAVGSNQLSPPPFGGERRGVRGFFAQTRNSYSTRTPCITSAYSVGGHPWRPSRELPAATLVDLAAASVEVMS